MILLLFACAQPAPEDTAGTPLPPADVPPVPAAGDYAVEVAGTWEGDCRFEDPATYQPPEQVWTADPRGEVLVLYLDYWTPVACSLDGLDFTCDTGSWAADRMQVTHTLAGAFSADETVAGAIVLELDCGGAGCDTLQDLYGNRLSFPCRAEAPFTGVHR